MKQVGRNQKASVERSESDTTDTLQTCCRFIHALKDAQVQKRSAHSCKSGQLQVSTKANG